MTPSPSFLKRRFSSDPILLEAHRSLASAFTDKKDWDRASAVYRRILAIDPKDIKARVNLLQKGEYRPKDNAERLELVRPCVLQRHYLAAARLFADAFAANPTLAGSPNPQHRYNAACYAALAGSGQSKQAEELDDTERTRWRKQSLDWLRADLATYEKHLESGQTTTLPGQSVMERLLHWQRDTDLVGIRDQKALAKLPAEERQECRQLWADVEALLSKVQKKTK